MMAMNIRSSVVMATNSGFSGKSVNDTLAGAVRNLSKNTAITNADEVSLSSAIDGLKPAPQKSAEQGTNATLPNNASRGPGIMV